MTNAQQREEAHQFYYRWNSTLMPDELRKAHQANDRAVMLAYGMPIKETAEAACVAWLMRLYQEKVVELENGYSRKAGEK